MHGMLSFLQRKKKGVHCVCKSTNMYVTVQRKPTHALRLLMRVEFPLEMEWVAEVYP